MTVPVAVGAIILGPKGGAICGLAFGITSFMQCFGMGAFGTMLFSINPLGSGNYLYHSPCAGRTASVV